MAKKSNKKVEKDGKKQNTISLRAFEMSQQLKFLGDNWEENLQNQLKIHEKKFLGWIYIVHDKDTEVVDGAEKKKAAHIHLYAKCADAYKISTLANIFGVSPQYIQKIHSTYQSGGKHIADIGKAFGYATHRGYPDKAQYPDSAVVAKEGYDWKAVRTESEERILKCFKIDRIVERIVSGEIKRYNLTKFVEGIPYTKYGTQIERAFQYRAMIDSQNPNRNMIVWFIHGKSGTGKTDFAKSIAEKENMALMIAGSNKDPFNKYLGQEAVLLDDLKGDMKFSLAEFLRIIDNNTNSAVAARYDDKNLFGVEMLFITSTLTMERFFSKFEREYDEEFYQLQRRCKMKVELTEDTIKMYTFRKESRSYEFLGESPNPIKEKYKNAEVDVPDEKLQHFCSMFGITYDPNKPKAETTQENSPTPAVQTAGIKRKDDTDNGRGEKITEESNSYDLPF